MLRVWHESDFRPAVGSTRGVHGQIVRSAVEEGTDVSAAWGNAPRRAHEPAPGPGSRCDAQFGIPLCCVETVCAEHSAVGCQACDSVRSDAAWWSDLTHREQYLAITLECRGSTVAKVRRSE